MLEKLDSKNLILLNELKRNCKIIFKEWENNYCEVQHLSNTATIFYNPNNVDNDSIAHELLHIWLDKFGYIITNHLFLASLSNNNLSKIFSRNLCNHIGNFFDHFKMYPKYLEMGYSPKKFIQNGLEEKVSIINLKALTLNSLEVYNGEAIDYFIGNLISIYADHAENNYTEHLELLHQKDKQLFNAVTNYWNNWTTFDITQKMVTYYSTQLSNAFLEEIKQWSENKIII